MEYVLRLEVKQVSEPKRPDEQSIKGPVVSCLCDPLSWSPTV